MPALIETPFMDRFARGKGAAVRAGNNTVALFKIDAAIYAIEAWCLRCGTSLAEGCLEGWIVACSGCDWRYDVTNGSVVGIAALRLHTFDAEVVGGQIIVADS
jgi:nitrite reductase/ring-hydroxylating ferredoxin subunit